MLNNNDDISDSSKFLQNESSDQNKADLIKEGSKTGSKQLIQI